MKKRLVVLSVIVLGGALLLFAATGFACAPGPGGEEPSHDSGNGGDSAELGPGSSIIGPGAPLGPDRDRSTVEREVGDFIDRGTLDAPALERMLEIALAPPGRTSDVARGVAGYMAAATLMRAGSYEEGRDLIFSTLDAAYDVYVNLWGDREPLRTLVAAELSLHAGGEGDHDAILFLQNRFGSDALTDRLLVRDAEGILHGRTRLADVLRFHKARAYTAAKMPDEARETLEELQFASGHIFVDNEVTGLRDAIATLQIQVSGMARLFMAFFGVA